MQAALKVDELSKTYTSGSRSLTVLDDINISIEPGESVAIVGPSGSGKTTLLGLCAGLDKPSTGSVHLYDSMLNDLSEDERAEIRNKHVGFIFQNFQLIPTLTALENVMIPLELQGMKQAESIATDLLERVGLKDRLDHYPSQLSGGEQQRVSLARAFSNSPKILFADEPTGNLDEDTSQSVEDLIFALNQEKGTTLIIVTHDMELANKTNRIIQLKGGKVVADRKPE
ncbi:MAG: ABC transporter ATP-binding protein [Bacteroidia bacterium]|nr:ABC transporter ATP-binding protein [Bacteroidia bacterium]